ncbi:MAG: hypothetical protein HKP40_10955 [Litoreibacter sp.]|nr:hypothetical protein [Litoreibacter sp.]
MKSVLILGSGPNVIQARDWDLSVFDHILVINNAWAVRPDWDEMIHPEDFPEERRPATLTTNQKITTADEYVPAQNQYGGFIYAGGTMAFTAAYWALASLKPSALAFLGCDMVYPTAGNTHFYGTGTADPLRPDITLQSIEAKSARLMIFAAIQDCAVVNLSSDKSRLVYPRSRVNELAHMVPAPDYYDNDIAGLARQRETELGYMVPSGRYWEHEDEFDAAALRGIDALWLKAARYEFAQSRVA